MPDHCTSCGKPFTEHAGIIQTCAGLQQALKALAKRQRAKKGVPHATVVREHAKRHAASRKRK